MTYISDLISQNNIKIKTPVVTYSREGVPTFLDNFSRQAAVLEDNSSFFLGVTLNSIQTKSKFHNKKLPGRSGRRHTLQSRQ